MQFIVRFSQWGEVHDTSADLKAQNNKAVVRQDLRVEREGKKKKERRKNGNAFETHIPVFKHHLQRDPGQRNRKLASPWAL